MITLRCTKKLQRHLGVTPDPEDREPSAALGDWCGNLVYMRAELPLILLTNERSLLCLVLPHDADPLAALGRRAAALLRRLGLPEHAIEREAFQLRQVRAGKTNNRRVLGSMNDAVLLIETLLFDESRRGPATLERCEDALARNLYSMLEYRHPVEVASGLLEAPPQPRELELERAREQERSPAPKTAASQRVPVRLSRRDRELIVEHGALLGEVFIEELRAAPPDAGELAVGFSAADLDALVSGIAGEARRLLRKQQELEALRRRLKAAWRSMEGRR